MSDALDKVLAETWETVGTDKTHIYVKDRPPYDPDGLVCECPWGIQRGSLERARARARVIAAAPEALRLLDGFMSHLDKGLPPALWQLEKARALLAALREAS